MGKEKSVRLQTSLLNAAEKKVLVKLAKIQPRWMTSDILTYFGVAAAVFYAVFCWLANYNVNCLARVRNTQRPKYGFFIDHSLDAITTCLFCVGIGLSPMMDMNIALFILAGYLVMSIYTYLSTIVLDEFKLTYASLGPTEVRLILIAVYILYIYNPWPDVSVNIFNQQWTVYDCIGAIVAFILFSIYVCSLAVDLRKLAKQDPPKKFQ